MQCSMALRPSEGKNVGKPKASSLSSFFDDRLEAYFTEIDRLEAYPTENDRLEALGLPTFTLSFFQLRRPSPAQKPLVVRKLQRFPRVWKTLQNTSASGQVFRSVRKNL